MPIDNTELNKELNVVVGSQILTPKAKDEKIISLLKGGADPFAITSDSTGNLFIPFTVALAHAEEHIVDLFLKHSIKIGHPIDLSQPYPNQSDEFPVKRNWIHEAALCTDKGELVRLKEHQDYYFPKRNFAFCINEKFHFSFPKSGIQFTTIWSVLLWTISINNIRNNTQAFRNPNFKTFFSQWMFRKPQENLTTPLDRKTAAILGSASTIISFLWDNGLNRKSTDHHSRTIIETAQAFDKAMNDPEIWERDIRPYIIWDGITQKSKALARTAQGKVTEGIVFLIGMRNFGGAHPVTCHAVPLMNFVLNKIDPKHPNAELDGVFKILDDHGKRLDSHDDKFVVVDNRLTAVEQQLADLKAKFDATAQEQYKQACANLANNPFYLDVFKRLREKTKTLLIARNLATVKIFTQTPPADTRGALNFLSTVSFGLQVAMPGAPDIPKFIAGIVGYGSKLREIRRNEAVFDATVSLDVEPENLATYVASILVTEAMKVHGNVPNAKVQANLLSRLFIDVDNRITMMHNESFYDLEDAICYLCADAAPSIRALKAQVVHIPEAQKAAPGPLTLQVPVAKPAPVPVAQTFKSENSPERKKGSSGSGSGGSSSQTPTMGWEPYAAITNGGQYTPPRPKFHALDLHAKQQAANDHANFKRANPIAASNAPKRVSLFRRMFRRAFG